MKLEEIKHIHFIGIGGIGASSLAQILHEKKKKISGSDKFRSKITDKLKKSGINVKIGHDAKNINKKHQLVVFSPAIPSNNEELKEAKKLGVKTISYPEALGELTKNYFTIAIAGTHGKSTTTAMTALILEKNGLDPTVIIGTKVKQFKNRNYRIGKSKYIVIEACEYKRSFLNIHPDILVITNLEADHLDYYKDFNDYKSAFTKLIENVSKTGYLIINRDNKALQNLKKDTKIEIVEWSHDDENKINLKLKQPGKFNQENAQNAATAAQILNIPDSEIKKSLETFTGTWRRMEEKKKKGYECIFIDDYAHHPTEIELTLNALREKYSDKKILVIFQPHQHSRTKLLLKEFGTSFMQADKVIIPNIYEVRDTEKDIKSVNTDDVVNEIKKHKIKAQNGGGLEKTAKYIKENHKNWDIIITMGAGDITTIYDML